MIELQGDCFTIGRKADNDLSINDHTASGHHARIVKVQAVYFLEDLNGTLVNDRRVERHQLRDADVITIGQHRIIFQEPSAPPPASQTTPAELDQTMVLSGKGTTASSQTTEARVLVTEGKTDRVEYRLAKPVSLIGSQDGAAIRLTGWFAPKSAAQISRRGGAYVISASPGTKRLVVNGQDVSGSQQLKNGDQIQVGGVTMTFCLLPSAA
jgi:pSer/pThr/pTyr-binding forkhead associated (FHA) protein